MLSFLLALGISSVFLQDDPELNSAEPSFGPVSSPKSSQDLMELDDPDRDSTSGPAPACKTFQMDRAEDAHRLQEVETQTAQQNLVDDVKAKIHELNMSVLEVKKVIRQLKEQVSNDFDWQEHHFSTPSLHFLAESDGGNTEEMSFKSANTTDSPIPKPEEELVTAKEMPAKKRGFWRRLRRCFSRKEKQSKSGKESPKSRGIQKSSRLSTESELSSEHRLSFLDTFNNKNTAEASREQMISFIDSLNTNPDQIQSREEKKTVQLADILAKIPDFQSNF